MRVASVIRPFSIGTLRSTRTRTRFPRTSAWSSVRKAVIDKLRQISFAMATAVSAIRFEKPHSLSYHDSTRTRVPSSTLVWSMWKVDDAGSWLKSIETFGSCV